MKLPIVPAVVVLLASTFFTAVEGRNIQSDSRAIDNYCYTSDVLRPQYNYFNTKTPYQFAKGSENIVIPAGCTPSKFWLVNRHGTRLSTSGKTAKLLNLPAYQEQIIDNYAQGATGGLCIGDLALLAGWKWDANITVEKDGYLTVQGWNDLKGIGQYFKAQFPSLFKEYSEENYHFRFTDSQRTKASWQGFVDGILGENAHEKIPTPPTAEVDTLLRAYEHCPLYEDQEDALDEPDSELSKFMDGPLFTQLVETVSIKGGFSDPLPTNVVEWMFDMCTFEKSWDLDKKSPWCALFNFDQVKLFEYAADIEDFYLTGSATALNQRLSCDLVQDMYQKLESGPTATAYFTHSTTVNLFLTGLGYAHMDTPLRADNYEQMADRIFLTSKNVPLASNVAAVRYECSSGTKVQFILNERPLQLDWCTNGLCDWEAVKTRFAHINQQYCPTYFCSK